MYSVQNDKRVFTFCYNGLHNTLPFNNDIYDNTTAVFLLNRKVYKHTVVTRTHHQVKC